MRIAEVKVEIKLRFPVSGDRTKKELEEAAARMVSDALESGLLPGERFRVSKTELKRIHPGDPGNF
jgi:hypothetical protein